jgi:hypothetical protein
LNFSTHSLYENIFLLRTDIPLKTILDNDLLKPRSDLSRVEGEISMDLGSCDDFCVYSSVPLS